MADNDPYLPPDLPYNPYEAPESPLIQPPRPIFEDSQLEPFSIGAAVSRAWRIYKVRFFPIMALAMGPGIVGYLYQGLGSVGLGAIGASDPPPAVMIVVGIAYFLMSIVLNVWLTAGQAFGMANYAWERPSTANDLFKGGPYMLSVFWGSMVYFAALVAVFLVVGLPFVLLAFFMGGGLNQGATPNGALLVVALIATMIGIMAVAVRLYMFQFLVVDRGLGGLAAIKLSYELTRGHGFELLGVFFLAGLIGFVGIFACFVGLLFTLPLGVFIVASSYVLLVNEKWGLSKDLDKPAPEALF